MKKTMKSFLAVLTAGLLATTMAACGSSTTGSSGTTQGGSATAQGSEVSVETTAAAAASSGEVKTIKLFHRFPQEPYNTFINDKIAEYEAAHPDIKIEVTTAANQDYKEKIKVVLGDPSTTPDIFFSWAGDFTERFIRENKILDLKPYFDADQEWKDSLLQSQMDIYTNDDGMIYGIPFRLDCKLFFYNKDIFDQNGLTVPTTWTEFMNTVKKLKDAGITPIAYGNQENWASAHYVGTLNQICVPDDVRAKDYNPTSGEFTDPRYVQALNYYTDLLPYMTENPNGVIPNSARQTFSMGSAAMYYGELVEIPNVREENPDINLGLFNFPKIEGAEGNQNILTGAPEGFVISSGTKYPDECVEFLKWFLGKDVGKEECQKIGWFNAAKDTTDGVTDQALVDGYNTISKAESMAPWLDNALYSTVCDEYLTAVSDLTNGDITAEEAMQRISEKAVEAQSLVKGEKTKS